MPRTHRLLKENRLWRLITVRWSAQLTDGLYQSALASYVLFSPERQASATAAAIAFTTVLLPYSLIGPFVGTILDKYSRRQILCKPWSHRNFVSRRNCNFIKCNWI